MKRAQREMSEHSKPPGKKRQVKTLILNYLSRGYFISPTDLAVELGVSRTSIHRCLRQLLKDKEVVRWVDESWVFYSIRKVTQSEREKIMKW